MKSLIVVRTLTKKPQRERDIWTNFKSSNTEFNEANDEKSIKISERKQYMRDTPNQPYVDQIWVWFLIFSFSLFRFSVVELIISSSLFFAVAAVVVCFLGTI